MTWNEDGETIITCKRPERERNQGEEVIHLSMRKSDLDEDSGESSPVPPSAPSFGMFQ